MDMEDDPPIRLLKVIPFKGDMFSFSWGVAGGTESHLKTPISLKEEPWFSDEVGKINNEPMKHQIYIHYDVMGWSMFSAAIPWDHLQHRAHQLPCIHCHHQECLQNAIGSLTHIAETPGPALLFEELLAWASWNKIIAFQSQVSDVIHQEFQRSQLGKMKNANKNTIQKVRSALVNGSLTCSSSCRISFHRRWSTLVACKVGIENSTPSTRKAAESKSPSESQCAGSTPFQMAVCRSSGHYSLAFLATWFSDDLPCRVHLMCVDASIDSHKCHEDIVFWCWRINWWHAKKGLVSPHSSFLVQHRTDAAKSKKDTKDPFVAYINGGVLW